MSRNRSWLLISLCLTSGLNCFFASAAPPPPAPSPDSALARVNDIRSLVAERRDFWAERCARNGLDPDSSIGSKFRSLEAICGYLRRSRSPPVKSSEDEEAFISRILRSGLLRRRQEEDKRSQSDREEGDIVGELLDKDRFVEALGKDEPPESKSWNGRAEGAVWSPIPVVELPIAVDDDSGEGKRSDGNWENRSVEWDSSSDLERFLESKRSKGRMTREKSVHGGPGTGHPRWSVYFIG